MKVTRDNIETHLLDYLLETIGKTRLQMFDAYRWRWEFTMTREQYATFHKYAVSLIMKTLRCSKTHALVAFERFWKKYGVRIKG